MEPGRRTVTLAYPDGTPRMRYEVREGPDGREVRHGRFVTWHPNGCKKSEGWFADGRLSGDWTFWHANGVKAGEGSYREGRQHGRFVYWDEEGEQLSEAWFEEGRLVEE